MLENYQDIRVQVSFIENDPYNKLRSVKMGKISCRIEKSKKKKHI